MSPALDWRTDGPRWPHSQHSRFVASGGITWHVQVMGAGPPLLLVHGTAASTHSFRALLPLLARRFTVVAPDLPGHAFSTAPPDFDPSLPSTAAALGRLLRDQLGLAPVVAAGHSAGAAVVARLALDGGIAPRLLVAIAGAFVPLRGLAASLFGPAARLLSRSPLAAQLVALSAREPDSVAAMLRSMGATIDRDGVALYARLARSPAHVAAVLGMLARWDLEPLWADLPRLAPRLLVVAGELDRAVPLFQQRETVARARDARLAIVRGAGHLPHEEQPDTVARLILDELDAHEAELRDANDPGSPS